MIPPFTPCYIGTHPWPPKQLLRLNSPSKCGLVVLKQEALKTTPNPEPSSSALPAGQRFKGSSVWKGPLNEAWSSQSGTPSGVCWSTLNGPCLGRPSGGESGERLEHCQRQGQSQRAVLTERLCGGNPARRSGRDSDQHLVRLYYRRNGESKLVPGPKVRMSGRSVNGLR